MINVTVQSCQYIQYMFYLLNRKFPKMYDGRVIIVVLFMRCFNIIEDDRCTTYCNISSVAIRAI